MIRPDRDYATQVEAALGKLIKCCRADNWSGYDPYDALNSRVLDALPLVQSKAFRVLFTQALKRFPINFRPFLQIPKTQNAKGIALFLTALIKLEKVGFPDAAVEADLMLGRLITSRSSGVPYWCWGYSFPWQTRTELVPLGAPNLIATVFAANALLDVYEKRGDARCLEMATSAARYIIEHLYWVNGELAGFAYPLPSMRNQVHNANFLAAALLCRTYNHTGDALILEPAMRVARVSASRQRANGSWAYGEGSSQGWIDNFHTGYNLCALRTIARCTGATEFDKYIERGFVFYRNHFFCADGSVKYCHDRNYPKDIHCVAQSLITLMEFEDVDPSNREIASSVFRWVMQHMWDESGFFFYRVLRTATIRTSYMRWSQAWMLLALTVMLERSAMQVESGDEARSGMVQQ